MTRISAIVFDFGGTLAFTHGLSFTDELLRLNEMYPIAVLQQLNMDRVTRDWLMSRFTSHAADLLKTDPAIIAEILTRRLENGPDLIQSAKPVLQNLATKFRLGLLTNVAKWEAVDFRKMGIAEYFTTTVQSFEAGHAKPSVEIFRECERRLNVRSREIVMIGDSLDHDVIGALNAGWNAVHLDMQQSDSYLKDACYVTVNNFESIVEVIHEMEVG